MPEKISPADDPSGPNAYRSTYLALKEILADTNPARFRVLYRVARGYRAVVMCLLVAAAVAPLSSALGAERQIAERQLERHAAVGETVRLRGHVNYHPCGSVIPTTIIFVQPPSHGTLSVRDEIVTSFDPELGTRDRCKGYSGQGKVIYYTRTTSGTDKFRYTSSSSNGEVRVSVSID
jgi:hypothetical protein